MHIYLHNLYSGRNRDSFRILLNYITLFNDYNIFFNYNQPEASDYLLIGTEDLIYKKESLEGSIQRGIDAVINVHKLNPKAKIILLDSTDSTAISQTYPILVKCLELGIPIKWLLKNQLLSDINLYTEKAVLGKWFFNPPAAGIDLWSLDIDSDIFRRYVNLTGWNIGSYSTTYQYFYPKLQNIPSIDVCAIYQHTHDENYDHGICSSYYYNRHRQEPYLLLGETKLNVETGKLPYDDYVGKLIDSKVCLSPFGMGEICYRDFEVLKYGSILIKPSMDYVRTIPDIYIPGVTYYPVKVDWSDLLEVINTTIENYVSTKWSIQNIRKLYLDSYNPIKIIKHWRDEIFTN